MKRSLLTTLGIASSSALVLAGLGCSGAVDDGDHETDLPGDSAQSSDDFGRSPLTRRPWHRRPAPPAGTTDGGVTRPPVDAGSPGSGGTSAGGARECTQCETARACCMTVSGGPLCTFSAATCESLDDVRRAAYVNACRVLLDTVARARTTLPSTCR